MRRGTVMEAARKERKVAVNSRRRSRRRQTSPPSSRIRPASTSAGRSGSVLELDGLDLFLQWKVEDLGVERELPVEGALDVLGPSEAVPLSLVGDVGERSAAGPQTVRHDLRLIRRYNLIVQTLEEQDRTGHLIDVIDRRPFAVELLRLGIGTDQAIGIARLELVGVVHERIEVGNPEVAGAGRERVAEGESGQRGIAAGTAAVNNQAVRIGHTALDEVAGSVDGIVHVHHAPLPLQPVTVLTSVPRAAAVVDVDHAEAAAGPELRAQVQCAGCRPGGSAMDTDDERRQLAGGGAVVGVVGTIVQRM